jgi:SdrD B-like domain
LFHSVSPFEASCLFSFLSKTRIRYFYLLPISTTFDTTSELSIIYGDEVEKHTPVAGITVIAKSKKSEHVFKTETRENGVFTFNDLEDGDYALSIIVPNGFEQVFRLEQHKYQERVIPVKKDNCGSAVIFKIRKT